MITFFKILLCFTIWLLLTADLSTANVLFGLAVAALLSGPDRDTEPLNAWLRCFLKLIIILPRAYFQAFVMILRPHREEKMIMEKIKSPKTPGMIFLDILAISFSPKTIVTRYDEGHFKIHCIERVDQRQTKKR